ncbi:DUF58 domain-containing protein [soil metagenome]
MLDVDALAKIRPLELRAKVVVDGFWSGIHRSPLHGFSVEFSEYRAYAPGDDPRHIDWHAFARTDKHYIKKYEDETNLRCQLLVDHSRSMGYASPGAAMTKGEYAATVAATLAYFLRGQGDAVGLTTFSTDIEDYLPPKSTPGHLRRLMHVLEKPPAGIATSLGEPLRRAAELGRKRGLFVLVSDLLAPLDELEARLSFLRARRHQVAVIQILDPREIDFDFPASAQFQDLESGRHLFVDLRASKADYLRKSRAHRESLRALCGARGIAYHLAPTDEPPELVLRKFIRAEASEVPA